jgi:hypothetical protein
MSVQSLSTEKNLITKASEGSQTGRGRATNGEINMESYVTAGFFYEPVKWKPHDEDSWKAGINEKVGFILV